VANLERKCSKTVENVKNPKCSFFAFTRRVYRNANFARKFIQQFRRICLFPENNDFDGVLCFGCKLSSVFPHNNNNKKSCAKKQQKNDKNHTLAPPLCV
jgi:hypothetical protein